MKEKIFLKFLFFTIIFFFLFYFKNLVLADSWTEYKCQGTGCGDDALYRICDETSCQPEAIFQDCQSWQICKNGISWSTSTIPACQCSSSCLAIPDNPFPLNGAQNVLLPVTLSWNSVSGANSYRYKIEEVIPETTTTSTQIPIDENSTCLLKSNTTYQWRVKACGNADGTNCGNWANWSFKTSAAPQPVAPLDPDREGPEKAENTPLNITLKWCESDFKYPDAEGPMAYRLFFCQEDENGKDICHPLQKRGEECDLTKCPSYLLVPEPSSPSIYPLPEFSNEKYAYFTKNNSYAWRVAACKDSSGTECTDFGQKWRFETTGKLEAPVLVYPPNDPLGKKPVGLPIVFSWSGSFGSASFVYEVYDESGEKINDGKNTLPNFTLDYPTLPLNKKYYWKVKPCWDTESKDCEDVWAEGYFWTTGRAPKPETMKPEGENIPIPKTFEWENIPGEKSFIFKISGNGLNLEKPVNEPKIILDYPDLHQERDYLWQVKTCARENGEVCGGWSEIKTFKTFKLSTPSNPLPPDNQEIFTYEMPKNFSWDPVLGARAYQYTFDYIELSQEEKNEKCPGLVGTKIIPPTITSSPSFLLTLECLGKYNWSVRACLDKNCQETGDWSGPWSFNFVQSTPVGKAGLVPCGRAIDYPETPWNEREPCQFKHIFILLRNIIDLFLWRIGLTILVLLAIATGVVYYFSMGAPTTMAQVKSILRTAGIGYGIIFLAWMIINMVLVILGYKVGVFGRWWEIKF